MVVQADEVAATLLLVEATLVEAIESVLCGAAAGAVCALCYMCVCVCVCVCGRA
jgi:hypothetical protein